MQNQIPVQHAFVHWAQNCAFLTAYIKLTDKMPALIAVGSREPERKANAHKQKKPVRTGSE